MIFHHIWEASSFNVDRIDHLIKLGKYNVNQKTLVGLNTPMHFAVLYENYKAIEALSKYPDILLNERNALG